MAVGLDSFSIREYTAKVRASDAGRCWPFAGGDGKEAERQQPPMDWRKFRWWGAELDAIRSGRTVAVEKEMLGAGEDGAGARAPGRKGKLKAPKKRSIVELFAAVPQIDGGGGSDEGAESVDGGDDGVVEKGEEGDEGGTAVMEGANNGTEEVEEEAEPIARKKDKKERKMMNMTDSKKTTFKIKKKKKKSKKQQQLHQAWKKGGKVGIRLKSKDKMPKVNLLAPVDVSQLLLGSVLKKCDKDVVNPDAKKKSATIKKSSKQKKLKETQKALPSYQRQGKTTEFSIQGILKNQKREESVSKDRTCLQNCVPTKFRGTHLSEKHVSFSGKDDILGHKNKDSSALELPPTQQLCGASREVLADDSLQLAVEVEGTQSEAMNEDTVVTENENQVSVIVANGSVDSLPETGQLDKNDSLPVASTTQSHNLHISRGIERTTFSCSLDLNRSLLSSNNVGASGSLAPNHAYMGSDYISRSSAVSSLSSTTSSDSQASSPPLTVITWANGGQSCRSGVMGNEFFHLNPECQPLCGLPQKDIMGSISSRFTSPKQLPRRHVQCGSDMIKHNPAVVSQNKYADKNFFGLPLNSQGEFIQLQSHGNLVFTKPSELQKVVLGSSSGFSVQNSLEPLENLDLLSARDKSCAAEVFVKERNFFPVQSNQKGQSSNAHITHDFDFPEKQMGHAFHILDLERGQDHYADQFGLSERSVVVPCPGCREQNRPQHRNLLEMVPVKRDSNSALQSTIQPTMRLMGQDVAVGRSNKDCQDFEDGKVWTDKEIVAEQNTVVTTPENSVDKWCSQHDFFTQSVVDVSRNKILHHIETQKGPNTLSLYQMNEGYPRLGPAHSGHEPYWLSKNGFTGSELTKFDSFITHPSEELLNKVPMTPETYRPFISSNPFGACQHLLLNSTQFKDSLPYSVGSISSPSFPNQNDRNPVQQEQTQFPSQNLPQWLVDATKQKKHPGNTSSCSGSVPNSHTYAVSEDQLLHLSSLYPTSVISFPSSASRTHFPKSPFHVTMSNYATDAHKKWNRDEKNKSTYKSTYTYLRGSDQPSKTKKRRSAEAIDLKKPVKKPNFVVLDGLDFPGEARKEFILPGCRQNPQNSSEYCVHRDEVVEVNDTERSVLSNEPASASLKPDTMPRSGPIKLSAGTKHILKPNRELDNSRPVYSTLPFATGSDSAKHPETQKKSAQIYQF